MRNLGKKESRMDSQEFERRLTVIARSPKLQGQAYIKARDTVIRKFATNDKEEERCIW